MTRLSDPPSKIQKYTKKFPYELFGGGGETEKKLMCKSR